jgi:hypothetical protein
MTRSELHLLNKLWLLVDGEQCGCKWTNDGGLSVKIENPRLFRDEFLEPVWNKGKGVSKVHSGQKVSDKKEKDTEDDGDAEGDAEMVCVEEKDKEDGSVHDDDYCDVGSTKVWTWAVGRMRQFGFELSEWKNGALSLEHVSFQQHLLRLHDIGVRNVWKDDAEYVVEMTAPDKKKQKK